MSELTPSGLTIDSVTEIVAAITLDLQNIYGADINVESNSPDGQMINIYAQADEDLLELLLDVYNTFGVQTSYGSVLDQRVALNGIARRQGTKTTTPVSITVNQALTLPGLDQTDEPAFTVSDNSGNQFALVTSHVFSASGSASLTFEAVDIGRVEVTANTITNQVTTILGVTVVNNPTTSGTVLGVDEETDAQLKVRQVQSFALAATGPADAITAALLALPDVLDAYIVENATDGTVNGTDPHSIWTIVRGGTDAEIAQAIYAKKGIGCGMRGAVTHTVARPNGSSFTAKWDVAVAQPLYIEFTINGKVAGTSFDTVAIADALADALTYLLGQSPTIGDVITAMQIIAPNGYLTAVGVSKNNSDFFDVVSPDDSDNYFTVTAANITVNT